MMSDLPLGASTWCFNGLLSPELRTIVDGGAPCLPEHTRAVRAYYTELTCSIPGSGIESLELWHSPALEDPQIFEQLKPLAEAGRISSMHAPFGRHLDLSSPDGSIRRAGVDACCSAAHLLSQLGGKTLVVHGSSQVEHPSRMPDYAGRSAASIAEIADRCADLGIDLAVENLAGHAVGSSGPELTALLELIGRPNVGVCLDTNHVFPPDRLLSTIRLLGPWLMTLHISDYDGVSEMHWLPTQGIMEWAGLVPALRAVEYSGPFLYEVRFEAPGIREAISVIEENYRVVMAAAV